MMFSSRFLTAFTLISSLSSAVVHSHEINAQFEEGTEIFTRDQAATLHARDFSLSARMFLDNWMVIKEGQQAFVPFDGSAQSKPILADDLTGCFVVLIMNSAGALFAHIPPVAASVNTQWPQVEKSYKLFKTKLSTPAPKVVILSPRLGAVTAQPGVANAAIEQALRTHLAALKLTATVHPYAVTLDVNGAFENTRFTVYPGSTHASSVVQINGVNTEM